MKRVLYGLLFLVAFLVSGITFIGMNLNSPVYNAVQILKEYPYSTGLFIFLNNEEKARFEQVLEILDKNPVLATAETSEYEIRDNTSYSLQTYYVLETEAFEFINFYDVDEK